MKKILIILFCAAFFFCVGSLIAYYNTSSFGYDNANIISFKSDSVQVLDFDIRYEDVKEKYELVKKSMPDKLITI